jgi:phage/plasmid-associated DNA primase
MREKMITEVADHIDDVKHKYSMKACDERISKSDRDVLVGEVKRFYKIQKNLFTKSFIDNTMKMAESEFFDEDFTNKLNKDPYLFTCSNGILQMRVKTGENPQEHVLLRAGTREDFVSFLAGHNFPEYEGINYIPYDASNPVFGEIYDFFNKIFPNRDLRDYFLRLIASSLEGTTDHMVYLWKGRGGNGKSKVLELVCLVFGDYQTSISSILCAKNPRNFPSMKNIRFMHANSEGTLNNTVVKKILGDDSILSKEEGEYKTSGKAHIHCNSTPKMDTTTRRSISTIPFESIFVNPDDPDIGKPNVFLRDNDLDKKLLNWREPFLSLLVHIYETQYLKNGLGPIPEVMKKENNECREDSFTLFQKQRVREEAGTKTTFKMIYRSYKKWHGTSDGRLRALNSSDLLKRINEEWGEPVEGIYFNKRVFCDEEDVDEFDGVIA